MTAILALVRVVDDILARLWDLQSVLMRVSDIYAIARAYCANQSPALFLGTGGVCALQDLRDSCASVRTDCMHALVLRRILSKRRQLNVKRFPFHSCHDRKFLIGEVRKSL